MVSRCARLLVQTSDRASLLNWVVRLEGKLGESSDHTTVSPSFN